jgi:hypothetical protein
MSPSSFLPVAQSLERPLAYNKRFEDKWQLQALLFCKLHRFPGANISGICPADEFSQQCRASLVVPVNVEYLAEIRNLAKRFQCNQGSNAFRTRTAILEFEMLPQTIFNTAHIQQTVRIRIFRDDRGFFNP